MSMITGSADFIEQWARISPWRVAIREVGTGKALHYGELSSRAWRLSNGFAAQGVNAGDRVAVLARNSSRCFETLIACLRLGAAYTPLNWRLAAAELVDILEHCGARVLIYDGESSALAAKVFEALPELRGVAWGEPLESAHVGYELLIEKGSDTPALSGHDAETVGMLLYTSGTTGRPKGVMISHRQLFWNAINTVYACDLGPDDRALACLPLFHTGGLNCLATPVLYRGGTVVLMEGFDAARAVEVIEEQRVTITVAVPTMYQMLLDAGVADDTHDVSSLQTLLCGGAPCPDPLLDAWLDRGFNFRQGFGMTEVGPNCFSLPAWMIGRRRGSVGMPVLHGDAKVIREDGQRAAPGEVGELCLGGPIICNGYWDDPENTAKVRRVHDDGQIWFHTGDLARTDEQGFFFIAGRRKEMFISGGENVYPAEIENVIQALDAVAEVSVIGVPDERWGEVGLAAVVARPGSALDTDAVRSWCVERLARFKVPKRFELMPELPHNTSGKVLKNALRERFVGSD